MILLEVLSTVRLTQENFTLLLLPALQSCPMILFHIAFAPFRFRPSPAHKTLDRSYVNLRNHWSWVNWWNTAKGVMNTWISPSQGDVWRKKFICSYRVHSFALRIHHIILTIWMMAFQWIHGITRTSPCCITCSPHPFSEVHSYPSSPPVLLCQCHSALYHKIYLSAHQQLTGQRTPATSAQSKKTIREKGPEQTSRQGHIWRKQSSWPSCICPRQLSRDSCSNSSSWMLSVCIPKSSFTLCNLPLSPAIKYGW